nr:DUF2298 domain-containing protein [Archaeoglobus neptunius]
MLIAIPFLRFFKYGEARFLSLLILTSVSFAIGFFAPFRVVFYSVFALTIAISLYIIYTEKPELEFSEAIFVAVFAFFIFLRFLNPHIFDSEKFMDSAFMNAVLKSSSFPPNDPFLAGGKLDFYYYFGHVISAGITLMSFSPPEVGYNIAVSALPAYTAAIIYEILRKKGNAVAFSGIVLAIFSGNLFSFVDFFRRIFEGIPVDGSYYWNATRVIENTINEFPYFSFIHADLHAHVVAIPIFVLILSLLYRTRWGKTEVMALALALFALFATNSWDYPLAVLICIFTAIALRKREIVIAVAISAPFVLLLFHSMNAPAAQIKLVDERSDLVQFLMYAFTPLLFAYVFTGNRYTIYLLPVSFPLYFLSPVLALAAPLLLSSFYGLVKRDHVSATVLVGLLAFIIPEFFAVESRLNTVFKFYLIGWLSLMISPAVKLDFSGSKKYIALILLVISLVYPLAATPVKYSLREYTLDGMVFMRNFDGDYEAVKWLQSREGVIIEEGCTHGALCAYHYGGRVAAFTGNPAVIAWTNHEYVWRRNYTLVALRAADVRDFYNATSCREMYRIVEKYNVSYIFLGYEEKRIFSVKPEKFERCFEKVFESRGTYIFATKILS